VVEHLRTKDWEREMAKERTKPVGLQYNPDQVNHNPLKSLQVVHQANSKAQDWALGLEMETEMATVKKLVDLQYNPNQADRSLSRTKPEFLDLSLEMGEVS